MSLWNVILVEPIGTVAPKVDLKDKVAISLTRIGYELSLICPAQGYPMPAFR